MSYHPRSDRLHFFRADFHIHTVLSPCAAVEMIPPLIIREAQEKNIDILAITDHNSTANAQAVIQAAEGSGIHVFPGVELHTREEVHVLCIFETLSQAEDFQHVIDLHMPPGKNQPDRFGSQYIVDRTGNFIRHEERPLNWATSLSISATWDAVRRLDGLFIPSHILRSMYGILPTLGFLPQNIVFDALEVSPMRNRDDIYREFPSTQGYTLVSNGDAHVLADIAGLNEFRIAEITLAEIRMALRHANERELAVWEN